MNNKDIDIDIERELPKAILKWYIFRKTDSVVYIGYPTDPLYECLQEDSGVGKIAGVDFLDIREWMQWKANIGNYDIAILSECFEKFEKPEQLISSVRQLLNANGLFFLLAHNRFGIRYFCGDRDPYTGRNFDGIEDYRKASTQKEDIFSGRMYDKAKLKKMLNQTGFCQSEFLSVFPGLESPFHILKDGYTPNEELNIRCFPMYHYPDTVFLEEQYLYTGMIENNLFHSMANAFLIISSKSQNRLPFDVGNEVLHVTSSLDRGVNNALQTIIYKERVEKRAVYSEGKRRLLELMNHNNELEKRGIHMIPADLKDDVYRMPYSKGENALSFFRRIAFEDKKSFIEAMDRFYRIILQSSEISSGLFEDEEDQILERGGVRAVIAIALLVGQTIHTYVDTLSRVIEFGPEHISAYSLSIEEGTPFAKDPQILSELPPEMVDRRMYEITKQLLAAHGYDRYEFSNYAKPGYECKHNMVYWTGGEYIGFGIGASSYFQGKRFNNMRDIFKYIELMENLSDKFVETDNMELLYNDTTRTLRENVTNIYIDARMEEFMFLGLRMTCGVSREDFKERFNKDIYEVYGSVLNKYIGEGFMASEGDRIYLTDAGIDVSNVILADFLLDS